MQLSQKIGKIEESVTLSITAKAGRLKAEGKDVISFGAGEPDFNTPDNIINKAIEAMQQGYTKYTPSSGIAPLKSALAEKFRKDNGLNYQPSQIVVSTGGKQSLNNAFSAILNPGDEVLIPSPYWVSYPELVKLSDGIPVLVETSAATGYKMTVDLLEGMVTPNTRAIIVNSPGNPTGSVYSEAELRAIADFAQRHDLYIISDEMYEKLVYDDVRHVSIASLSEDAYGRTITVNGVSKAYSMTGWRIGYCAADEKIVKLMSNLQSHTTSNPCSISQYAALEAIAGDQTKVEEMRQEFARRKDLIMELADGIPGVSYIKPEGAFYLMLNVAGLFGKAYGSKTIHSGMDFSEVLLNEKLVAVVPGEAFGDKEFVRLSYATSKSNIEEGLNRIKALVLELK